MLIKGSKQASRRRWPERFPVPRNFGASVVSRIEPGMTWPESVNAKRVQHLRVVRYEPESGRYPGIDIYAIDRERCGPMRLDALLKIKSEIAEPAAVFPLNNIDVIKDLVGDQNHAFAQYHSVPPWLRTKTPRRR